jgi:hypothetical protein
MATSAPDMNGYQNGEDNTPDHGLSNLSLSSKTIHADDFLNQGQDVAPAMHVSTTYRYNRDPDKLRTIASMDVSPFLQKWGKSADPPRIARTSYY